MARVLYPRWTTLGKTFVASAAAGYLYTTLNIETLGLHPNRWFSTIDRSVDQIFTSLENDYNAAMVKILSKDGPLDLVEWATVGTHLARLGAQSYAANTFYEGYLLSAGRSSNMRNWVHQAYFEYHASPEEVPV